MTETTNIARCKDCRFFRVWYLGIGNYRFTCDYLARLEEDMNEDNIACEHIKLKEKRP